MLEPNTTVLRGTLSVDFGIEKMRKENRIYFMYSLVDIPSVFLS